MKYFAMIDGRRVGPATIEELVAQGLRPSDYVWHKGLDDWQPAHLDAEICRHFRGRLLDKLHPNMAPVALPDKAEEQVEKAPENMRYGEVRWNINQHDKEPEPSGMPALVPGWLIILSFIAFSLSAYTLMRPIAPPPAPGIKISLRWLMNTSAGQKWPQAFPFFWACLCSPPSST